MNPVAEVFKVLVSPIEKLIELIAKGIGKLYEPKHLKKMYKARTEIIKDLKDSFENSGLQITIKNNEMEVNNTELAKRAISRLEYQELHKQKNIENVIGLAYHELEKCGDVTVQMPTDDWIIRFFNCVQDVSTNTLQNIWCKILTSEIKNPSTVSMRTLELLKNLTVEEANNINTLFKTIMKNNNLYFSFPIKGYSFFHLSETGFIINEAMRFDLDNDNSITLENQKWKLVLKKHNKQKNIQNNLIKTNQNDQVKKFDLDKIFVSRVNYLTESGIELYKSVFDGQVDENYLKGFFSEYMTSYPDYIFNLTEK